MIDKSVPDEDFEAKIVVQWLCSGVWHCPFKNGGYVLYGS